MYKWISQDAHEAVERDVGLSISEFDVGTIRIFEATTVYKTGMRTYYLKHCNTAQIWSWCTEFSSSVVNRYPAIHVISCVGEKNGKITIVSSFSAITVLCYQCVE